jgi:hypothetical protein
MIVDGPVEPVQTAAPAAGSRSASDPTRAVRGLDASEHEEVA